ncbi:hypothetical protein ACFQ36_20840, partial [Arthrobacter sp. GCM10027362]
ALPAALERALPGCVQSVKVFGWHYLAYSAPVGLGLLAWACIQGGAAAAFSAPLWLPTAAAWGYGLGHFSGILLPGSEGLKYVFSLPWWVAAAMVLLAAAMTLAASLMWLLRRDNRPETLAKWNSWAALPAVFTAGGLLLTLLGSIVAAADGGFFGSFSGTVGPAPWTFLVLGLWGVAIEAAARFLAPLLVPYLPARARKFLAGGTAVPPVAGLPPAPAAAPSPAALPQPKPLGPAARKRLKAAAITAGGAVVLGAGGMIAYSVLAATVFGPQHQVEGYLQALQDGDAVTAAQILDPNVTSAQRVLLDNEIFGAAENRITGYRIKDVTVEADTAVVTAEVTQDARTTGLTFGLEADGRTALVFNQWRVGSGPGWPVLLDLPAGLDSVTVNGVAVRLPAGSGSYESLPALPGSYVVAAPEGTRYTTFGEDQVLQVTAEHGQAPPSAVFAPKFTDAVTGEAVAQAKAYLAKCLEAAEFEPAGCPNSTYVWGDDEDVRNISWSLETEPAYEVGEDWGGQLTVSARDGRATVSYEENEAWDEDEPAEWEAKEDSSYLSFSGTVAVAGDDLTVTFGD